MAALQRFQDWRSRPGSHRREIPTPFVPYTVEGFCCLRSLRVLQHFIDPFNNAFRRRVRCSEGIFYDHIEHAFIITRLFIFISTYVEFLLRRVGDTTESEDRPQN